MFILLSPKYVQNAVIDWCAGRLFLAIQSCLPQTSLPYLSLMPKSKKLFFTDYCNFTFSSKIQTLTRSLKLQAIRAVKLDPICPLLYRSRG